MSRTNYIVTYDISNPKRLRKVFKACKDYGVHLQLSVFECDLTPAEKIDFESRLRGLIDRDEDQVLFIALGPTECRGQRVITALGQSYVKLDPACFVA
jgi:CRISPR-associated protein Cas2